MHPAADLLAKLSSAFERQHAALLERERTAGDRGPTYEQVMAEIAAEREASDA